MPLWTSLLVRIVACKSMLQQNGVVNDSLVAAGILSDDNRLASIAAPSTSLTLIV